MLLLMLAVDATAWCHRHFMLLPAARRWSLRCCLSGWNNTAKHAWYLRWRRYHCLMLLLLPTLLDVVAATAVVSLWDGTGSLRASIWMIQTGFCFTHAKTFLRVLDPNTEMLNKLAMLHMIMNTSDAAYDHEHRQRPSSYSQDQDAC